MVQSFVSIDPSIRNSGVARWIDGKLSRAYIVQNKNGGFREMAFEIFETTHPQFLVIEFPQTYGGKAAKGDTNDLLKLAACIGAIVQKLDCETTYYTPHEWKGNMPKNICANRVISRLSPDEHKAIQKCAPSLMHNIYDAIGIGLKYLGRF